MELVVLAAAVTVLQPLVCAQTAVSVKFLSPPHGYSHNLQVSTRGGVAVTKEERLYPGDPRHASFKPNRFKFNKPLENRYQAPPEPTTYFYPRPSRPFAEYGPPPPVPEQYSPPPISQQYGPPPVSQQYGPPADSQQFGPPPLSQQYGPPTDSQQFGPPQLSQQLGPPPVPLQYSPLQVPQQYGPPLVRQADGPPEEPYLPTGEYHNPAVFGLSQHQTEVTYDPHLITGPQAAQYVAYLLTRGELFFHLIPHERLVLLNQQERVENNLVPHVLGSIRPGHPFFHR